MAKASLLSRAQRAQVTITGTVVGVVVVAALYWAQAVFIPVALAVFLAFLLAPAVGALQRWGLGRIPSVILVTTLAGLLLAGLTWLVGLQVLSLLVELPKHSDNIKTKVQTLRELTAGSGSGGFSQLLEEITAEWQGKPPGEPADPPAKDGTGVLPTTVVVQPPTAPWIGRLPGYLSAVLGPIGGLALAVVLVIFMLLKREDLRNRFLRLVGQGRMSSTTKAVDDAAQRVSRYLLMQAIINGTYGLALAGGLFLLGVKYAFLWGFLAGVLRYVPYIGPWVAAIFPIGLSLAMYEGWWQPLAVIGLFLVLELVSNNVMEPWLYGQTLGVSEVALMVAAAFWTFLWGPIGLVLSAPLTVCLVVLGKYVPQLEFLDVLLGDEPPLDPDAAYYQRLVARDQDEAAELVQTRAQEEEPEQLYDEILVPALTYAKRDRERDELTDEDEEFILRATEEILDEAQVRRATEGAGPAAADGAKVQVLACPARDGEDRLALEMLRQLLEGGKWEVEVLGSDLLSAELVARAAEKRPGLICVGSLPPGGLAHTRYLCKRLRAALPKAKIVVGRWGLKGNVEANQEQLRQSGADVMTTTLLETRAQLNALQPVLEQERAAERGQSVRV